MKKDNSIQIARAIAVIMVLIHHSLSHIEQTKAVIHITFALNHVHVVVFFVIAGLLFEKQKDKIYQTDFQRYFMSKWNRLMVPYLFWFLLISIAVNAMLLIPVVKNIVLGMGYQKWNLWNFVWNTITMQDYYVMHLWFVYVLFGIYIVNYIGKNLLSEWKIFCLLFFVTIILKNLFVFPILIDRFLIYYMYFFFGRMLIRYGKKDLFLNCKISVAAFFAVFILAYMEYTIPNSFSYTYIGNFIWGIAGTQLVLVISRQIIKKTVCFANVLKKIGDSSYSIYLIHNPYVLIIFFMIMRKVGGIVPVYIQVVLSVILCVVIPMYVEQVIKRMPKLHKIMFGS